MLLFKIWCELVAAVCDVAVCIFIDGGLVAVTVEIEIQLSAFYLICTLVGVEGKLQVVLVIGFGILEVVVLDLVNGDTDNIFAKIFIFC